MSGRGLTARAQRAALDALMTLVVAMLERRMRRAVAPRR
jgi:hypothetical protein